MCKPEFDEVNQSVREAVSNLPSDASTKKNIYAQLEMFFLHIVSLVLKRLLLKDVIFGLGVHLSKLFM